MCVRVGDLIFDDWVNLKLLSSWCDTFIIRLAVTDGLPPSDYAGVVRGLADSLRRLRPDACIWVQICNPRRANRDCVTANPTHGALEGEAQEDEARSRSELWFQTELQQALRFARLPIAVSLRGVQPSIWDFNYFPRSYKHSFTRPPAAEPYIKAGDFKPSELTCLRVLARANCAYTLEVASLAGLSAEGARVALRGLMKRRLVTRDEKGKYPLWKICRPGVSRALRSWGHPPGRSFQRRKERGRDACRERIPEEPSGGVQEVNYKRVSFMRGDPVSFLARIRSPSGGGLRIPSAGRHRRTARLWPAWVRRAWPYASIWAGWTEVTCGLGRPDTLCWGQLYGYETLFWLEVESGHNSRREIQRKTVWRVNQALLYARRCPVRLVFAFLAPLWVREAAVGVFQNLPGDLAVVLEDWKSFGRMPRPEWGRVSWNR